jgi:uncharacterized protein
MHIGALVREFGSPAGRLPAEPLQWALDHWDEAAPRLLQMFDAFLAGEDTSDVVASALFFALHLFAERAERAAFSRLCRLLHDNEGADMVLGDAVTETLQQMLISLYDGDREALAQLIEGPDIDGFVRHAAFQAWAYLTFTGQIRLDHTKQFLLMLYDSMQPQAENHAWAGFAELIALLGLRSHRLLVKKLFARGLLDPGYMDLEAFDELLARGADRDEQAALFESEHVGPFVDTIGTLGSWASFSRDASEADDDLEFDPELDLDIDLGFDGPQEPVINPYRRVGRNDPCPCGSGKKFKKCCLGKPDAVAFRA